MSFVSQPVMRSLVNFLEQKQLTKSDCLEQLQISEQYFDAPNSHFTLRDYHTLMRWAHQKLNCPHIGLLFGADIDVNRWGVLGHLASVCADLRHVIEYGRRFHPLVRHTQSFTLHQQANSLTLDLGATNQHCHYVIDELFASWMVFARQYILQGDTLLPEVVELTQPQPQNSKIAKLYDVFFKSRVRFGCATNRIIISRQWLNAQLKYPDKQLEQVLLHQAQQQLNARFSLVDSLRQQIIAHFPEVLTLEQSSQLTQCSSRTLQRQLQNQGISHKQLVDQCRKKLATELFESGYNALDIANKLGFSEQSALQRAFKRWHGMPPKRYLRQINEI